MKYKIVADSSSNLYDGYIENFSSVPLKIICGDKEYIDIPSLDTNKMMNDLKKTKERSSTSCPNVLEWRDAFGDADNVFAVTITSGLSGSYSAAMSAKKDYITEYPDKNVYVIDSLSAGPELHLIVDKLCKLISQDLPFETIKNEINEYKKRTHLFFSLESLDNLAKNGRVNPAVAKIAGILGIRVIGKASDEGKLQQLFKCRGEAKAIEKLASEIGKFRIAKGKLIIAHAENEKAAQLLAGTILKDHPLCSIQIESCGGLCSYYAEEGGLLIGIEEEPLE